MARNKCRFPMNPLGHMVSETNSTGTMKGSFFFSFSLCVVWEEVDAAVVVVVESGECNTW